MGCLLGALAGLNCGGENCDPGLRELEKDGVISLDLGVLMSCPDLCVVRGLAIGVDSLALHGRFSDLKRP